MGYYVGKPWASSVSVVRQAETGRLLLLLLVDAQANTSNGRPQASVRVRGNSREKVRSLLRKVGVRRPLSQPVERPLVGSCSVLFSLLRGFVRIGAAQNGRKSSLVRLPRW
jgi:hypothetical protein